MKQSILSLLVFLAIVSTAFSQAANSRKNKPQVQFDSLYKKAIAAYQAGEMDRIPAKCCFWLKKLNVGANDLHIISVEIKNKGSF